MTLTSLWEQRARKSSLRMTLAHWLVFDRGERVLVFVLEFQHIVFVFADPNKKVLHSFVIGMFKSI